MRRLQHLALAASALALAFGITACGEQPAPAVPPTEATPAPSERDALPAPKQDRQGRPVYDGQTY